MKLSNAFPLVLLACAMAFAISQAQADQCWVTGDVNGDGIPLTIGGDIVPIIRFVEQGYPLPDSLHKADLNGDCVIDAADAQLCHCYFTYGMSCFRNPFPFLTCCNPDTIRGACCDSLGNCAVRSPANCAAIGGTYHGDGTSCLVGSHCEPCGDLDGDGVVDISDIVWLIECIFVCQIIPQSAEVNCDGTIDISDVVYLVNYVFRGGPAPCANCP